MKYVLTRVYNNLPPNKKQKELDFICRLYIGTECTPEELRDFYQNFKKVVESLNQRYSRTTALETHKGVHYFSAKLPGTDKSICLNFEPIKRTYPELMRYVLGQDRC